MGKLTMNAGIVNFDPENPENSLVTLNFRYPKGTSAEELQAKFKQQSVKRSLQHKEIATKNRIMYQLMIHWWQRYYKFTKTIQAKKARTNHWWRYLWPLIKTWCCLWRNVPWLHRHNAPSQRIYGIR